ERLRLRPGRHFTSRKRSKARLCRSRVNLCSDARVSALLWPQWRSHHPDCMNPFAAARQYWKRATTSPVRSLIGKGRLMDFATSKISTAISTFIRALPLSLMIAVWFAAAARAQNYPNGPIHIIVPYAAGGLTDALARITGGRVADAIGQPVIVENRPGASSIIGMEACANAKPDGQTVCLTVADSLSYNPQLFANLPYDPEKSFTAVIRLAWTNNLLVANAKAPFDAYEEMIGYAKANPGKLNWGTWGPATLPDLYLRWISFTAGVDIQAIPYKGGAAQANQAVSRRRKSLRAGSSRWLPSVRNAQH